MFDAKSLLEMIAKGASGAPQQSQSSASNPLEDLLRQFTQGQQSTGQGTGGQGAGGQGAGSQGGGLEDLLRNMLPGQQAQAPQAAPGQGDSGQGGIGDILGQLQKNLGGTGAGAPGGGIGDLLGQVFGQATSGVREGAQKIDDATGAGDQLRRMIEQLSGGRNTDEIMAQVKELIANNQLGTGAALGGLGALILGTRTGRGLATGAAKLGALALIGGLAYKAYQNYSQGRPVLDGGQANGFAANPQAAPSGSGYEPDAVSNDTAALMVRAMLASAAADGRIDSNEQQKILGGLQQAGLDSQAEAFIQQELHNPASPSELAAAANSPEQALQIFTAARIAVDIDSIEEQQFLADLANQLGLDPALAAHIDAEARAAA